MKKQCIYAFFAVVALSGCSAQNASNGSLADSQQSQPVLATIQPPEKSYFYSDEHMNFGVTSAVGPLSFKITGYYKELESFDRFDGLEEEIIDFNDPNYEDDWYEGDWEEGDYDTRTFSTFHAFDFCTQNLEKKCVRILKSLQSLEEWEATAQLYGRTKIEEPGLPEGWSAYKSRHNNGSIRFMKVFQRHPVVVNHKVAPDNYTNMNKEEIKQFLSFIQPLF
jgi:hypothetical protein